VECQQELLECVAETPSESIQKIDDIQFHVTSKSRPGLYHAVDLHRSTCKCEDFLRIQFCRHIAAILCHFSELSPQEINSGSSPRSSPEGTESLSCPQHIYTRRPEVTLQALTQDISMLSHTLAATQAAQFAKSMVAQSTAVIEAARSAKYSLSAVITATQGNAPLPNPDVIAWNHKSWMETTKQMGFTKKSSNRPRPAKESGLTAQSISVVKGKHVKSDAPSTVNAAPPRQVHSWYHTSGSHDCASPPPVLLGSCLWALQSLRKWTHLRLPPLALPGSCLRALHSPHFWKHSLSMLQHPRSSLPHLHKFT
jgi:hypothetical protein